MSVLECGEKVNGVHAKIKIGKIDASHLLLQKKREAQISQVRIRLKAKG
jgi:hypothetical protein